MISAIFSCDFHILKTVLGMRDWLFCEKLRNSWLQVDRVGIENASWLSWNWKCSRMTWIEKVEKCWNQQAVPGRGGFHQPARRPPLDRNIQIPTQWAFKLDQIFLNGILQRLPRVSGKGFIIEQSNHQVSLTRLSFGSFDFHWTLNLKITFKSLRPC